MQFSILCLLQNTFQSQLSGKFIVLQSSLTQVFKLGYHTQTFKCPLKIILKLLCFTFSLHLVPKIFNPCSKILAKICRNCRSKFCFHSSVIHVFISEVLNYF